MDRYSLIVFSDDSAPIRRYEVRKDWLRRWLWIGAVVAAMASLALIDYVRVRIDHAELAELRVSAAEQRATIDSFEATVTELNATLVRMREFEHTVRTIANLPGSDAAGGGEVLTVGAGHGDLSSLAGGGIDVEPVPVFPRADTVPVSGNVQGAPGEVAAADDRVSPLPGQTRHLALVAEQRRLSLQELVAQLEDKHMRLASSPAVWPTEGWLTSRFGSRISPFTGKRQFHSGIDIAGAPGTDVIATARGKVVYAGKKGPLGRTVIVDHGFGIRTHYGHNDKLLVKKGERVERGQALAHLGNSGRSTGPHLHYTVEVRGKAVNPLDYIFD